MSGYISMPQALTISIVSILMVFVVLLVISYLIRITAFILNPKKQKTEKKKEEKAETIKEETKTEDDDLNFVIAAAVAAYMGSSSRYVIKSIRQVDEAASWENWSRIEYLNR